MSVTERKIRTKYRFRATTDSVLCVVFLHHTPLDQCGRPVIVRFRVLATVSLLMAG